MKWLAAIELLMAFVFIVKGQTLLNAVSECEKRKGAGFVLSGLICVGLLFVGGIVWILITV